MKYIINNTLAILSRKEKGQLYRLIGCTIIISIADIVALASLVFIVSFYTQPEFSNNLSFLPTWLMDRDSILLVLFFLFFFMLKNLAAFFVNKAQYRFIYSVASRISQQNMIKYLEGSYTNYVNIDSAVHIRKISQQPVEFCHYVLSGLQQISTEIVLISLAIMAVLLFNAKLFLLLLVLLLPAVILVAWLTRKKLGAVRKHIKASSERSLQHLKEALSGFIESNIYDKHVFFTARYAGYQKNLNTYLADLQVTQSLPSRLFEVFAVLGLFILVAINKVSGNLEATGLINMTAFMAAAYKIIPGIVKIGNLSSQVRTYGFTVNDLVKEPSPVRKSHETIIGVEKIQSVELHNIHFTHHKTVLLENFNLAIKAGEMVGLSGLSGKGKTTVINLLLGFLEPGSGDININSKSTTDAERRHYWQDISYVKQQPFLIHDTIQANITLGESQCDEKRLMETIRVCGINELLDKSSKGIHTIITENGKNISGGQRQRIAIARAIYKDAGLIILDEPFNELDKASELSLLNYFRSEAEGGKAVLLITHNKESLTYCHKVISLDE